MGLFSIVIKRHWVRKTENEHVKFRDTDDRYGFSNLHFEQFIFLYQKQNFKNLKWMNFTASSHYRFLIKAKTVFVQTSWTISVFCFKVSSVLKSLLVLILSIRAVKLVAESLSTPYTCVWYHESAKLTRNQRIIKCFYILRVEHFQGYLPPLNNSFNLIPILAKLVLNIIYKTLETETTTDNDRHPAWLTLIFFKLALLLHVFK